MLDPLGQLLAMPDIREWTRDEQAWLEERMLSQLKRENERAARSRTFRLLRCWPDSAGQRAPSLYGLWWYQFCRRLRSAWRPLFGNGFGHQTLRNPPE